MNYQRIYEHLTAKDMIADYTEKHHIIPKCMGGTDDPSNLVQLTPEAHYVAHQLLVKIYPDNRKLVYAVTMMIAGTYRNNKIYGWIKRKNSIARQNPSDETREKLRVARKGKPAYNKGKPMSSEQKEKLSAKAKLRPLASSETREKLSKANKGKVVSAETREKLSKASKGKSKSDEHKAKLKIAKQHISAETRAKISDSQQGRILSEEHKAKISASHKGKPHSTEARANMSNAKKGHSVSAETRAKISNTLKARAKLTK